MFDRTQKKLFLLFYTILFTTHLLSSDVNLKESAISVAESSKDLVYSLGSLFKSIGHECKEGIKKWHDSFVAYVQHMKDFNSSVQAHIESKDNKVEITITGFEAEEMQKVDAEIEYDRHQFPVAVTVSGNDKKSVVHIIHHIDSSFITVKVTRKYEKKEIVKIDGKEIEQVALYKDEANRVASITEQLDLENLSVEFDTTTKTMEIEIPYKEKHKKTIEVKIK